MDRRISDLVAEIESECQSLREENRLLRENLLILKSDKNFWLLMTWIWTVAAMALFVLTKVQSSL